MESKPRKKTQGGKGEGKEREGEGKRKGRYEGGKEGRIGREGGKGR